MQLNMEIQGLSRVWKIKKDLKKGLIYVMEDKISLIVLYENLLSLELI